MHKRPPSAPPPLQELIPSRRAAGRRAVVLVAVLGAILLPVHPAVAAPAQADQGEALFRQSCASCHTIGGGDTAGPDLEGVVGRTGEERVRAFIASPEDVIASGDPEVDALVERFGGVQMPNLGLAPDQVDALVAYLAAQEAGGADEESVISPPPADVRDGDAAAGEDLFTGAEQFENGGTSCLACHAIAGAGSLGGGQVGPDLTSAYSKYGGADGIASVLATLPFPSMLPVYDGHALTEREQADLAAFLASTDGEEAPADRTWLLIGLGACVTAFALGLMLLVWPRRRLVVRRDIAPAPSPRRH